MNYPEALEWLYRTQLHGIQLGLRGMLSLQACFPQQSSLPAQSFLHVAGTNGKGSVCAFLDSACRAAGLRSGLYTSPHLSSFRERIRVNGSPIPEASVAALLTLLREKTDTWLPSPTFFELVTAIAFAHFKSEKTDVTVLETGMGGRLDATNIILPKVSIITPIGLDHQEWLGSTLEAIAREKAGIFKPGVPVVSAPQPEPVLRVLRETASRLGCHFECVSSPYPGPVGLVGSHQKWNAALAAKALEVSGLAVSSAAVDQGFQEVTWPGRFQDVGNRTILDGAHNPHAAQRLAATWQEIYGQKKATLILGMMRDKDIHGFCSEISPIAKNVVIVPVQNLRSLSPANLADLWQQTAPHIPVTQCASLQAGLQAARSERGEVLVTGSLFLIGEVLSLLGLTPASEQQTSQ